MSLEHPKQTEIIVTNNILIRKNTNIYILHERTLKLSLNYYNNIESNPNFIVKVAQLVLSLKYFGTISLSLR